MSDELLAKYRKFAEPGGPLHDKFTVLAVVWCNHKPHPFVIGDEHVAYASARNGGRLTEEAIDRSGVGCCMRVRDDDIGGAYRCNLPRRDHTADRALVLQLLRNLTNEEAADALFPLKEGLLADKIDGVTFVDTPEKFRVAKPEPKDAEADAGGGGG